MQPIPLRICFDAVAYPCPYLRIFPHSNYTNYIITFSLGYDLTASLKINDIVHHHGLPSGVLVPHAVLVMTRRKIDAT